MEEKEKNHGSQFVSGESCESLVAEESVPSVSHRRTVFVFCGSLALLHFSFFLISKTFWPRSHPVMFPHLQTDHWSKTKTMVPDYQSLIPPALLKDSENRKHKTEPDVNRNISLSPSLTETATSHLASIPKGVNRSSKGIFLPHNMPQYRNVFNDRARRNFCYWLVEKKSTSERSSMGGYKTSLGIPKM